MSFGLRRLDGDATFLFVFTGVGESSFSSFGTGDDTSLGYKGVSQSWLSMIYVSNDGHVSDVLLLVHHPTDFVYCKVHLKTTSIKQPQCMW